MKAAVLERPYEVVVQEVATPDPGLGEVLLRVRATGICGSDLHTYRGHHPYRKPPVILGHEVAGEVVAAGPGVTDLAPGERVAVEPHIYCGTCRWCRQGLVNLCVNKRVPGVGWQGTFAEFFPAPARVCHRLAPEVSWAEGSMIEPLAVAYRTFTRAGVGLGESVAVLGQGTIGALITLLAAAMRPPRLLVTDVQPYNLEVGHRLGATHAVNPDREDVVAAGEAATGGRGFEVVFVAAGGRGVLDQAFALASKRGRVVVVSLFAGRLTADFNRLVTTELQVLGSQTYTSADFAAAAELVNGRRVDLRPLITGRVGLDDLPDVLREIDQGLRPGVKTVVEPQ